MKPTTLIALTGSLAVAGISNVLAADDPSARPNILLVLVDDMGFKDTGYTGSDFYETPIIDSLAQKSVRFTNGYACAGNSAPSRACLISGQYNPRHGVFAVTSTKRGPADQMKLIPYPNNQNLPLECYTVAEAMRDAGYATALVGKWHLGTDSDHVPKNQGFESGFVDHIPDKDEFAKNNDPKNIFSEIDGMCAFMEESVKSGKPFFGYLPLHAVHQSWQARKEYVDYFKSKPAGKQHDQAVYAAMIKHVDDAVGILVGKLKEIGADKNTIIVFTSDNGGVPQTRQTPLRGFKGCLYEGGIRVPLFVHNPYMFKAKDCDIPISNIDFYPTFLDFASGQVPADKILDGESLKPVLMGKASKLSRESLFWHFPGYLDKPCPGGRDQTFRQRPSTVIRKGDWKLTLYYEEWMLDGGQERIDTNNSVELYNLKTDVSEQQNLANTNKDKRDELLGDLLAWVKKTNAQLPKIK